MPVFVLVAGGFFQLDGVILTSPRHRLRRWPTAMHGYILAREMGGDAPLYANAASLQVVVSFVDDSVLDLGRRDCVGQDCVGKFQPSKTQNR